MFIQSVRSVDRAHATQRGYTLIDMAMALVIAGLVVSGLAMGFKIYFKDRQINTTKDNVQVVSRAIENFVLEHGRFPCPAAIDLETTNTRFGDEADCQNRTGYTAAGAVSGTVAAGGFNGGIWVEHKVGDPAVYVVRGMVPFTALNLPEFYAVDGYGNRLQYAVTASQTSNDDFAREGGAISVIDSYGEASTDQTKSNHFLIFSSGANREGAYTRYGKQILACGNGLDGENCNTLSDPTAVYRAARYSTVTSMDANASGRFDDIVANNNTMILPLWRLADNSDSNMRTVDSAKMVAVGTVSVPAPVAAVKMNVEGVARTSQRALAADFCLRNNEGKCFEPRMLAGASVEMDCNSPFVRAESGTVMRGIAEGQARCRPDLTPQSCSGADEYIAGFEPDGKPICKQFIYTIPPVAEPPAQCQPAHDTRVIDCPAGQRGEIEQERFLQCPSGTWTAWSDTNNTCVSDCVSTTEYRTVGCGAGQTGNINERRVYNCATSSWSGWTAISDNCASSCDATSYELQTIACPVGQTGNINQRRNIVCGPPASWGAWYDLSSNCCLPTFQTDSPGCPSGYVGSHNRRRDYQCPAAAWTGWYDTTYTCQLHGSCGSAHGQTLGAAPSGGSLCNSGSASSVRGSGPWDWDCNGANGGSSPTCYADKTATAGCFRDYEFFVNNGGSIETVSVTCSNVNMGSPTAIFGSYASPGHSSTSVPQAKVDSKCTATCIGTCGSANGVASATAPSSDLCSSAINMSPAVTDTGTGWSWTCGGNNSNASCSAPKPATGGVCGNVHGTTRTTGMAAVADNPGLCAMGGGSPSVVASNPDTYTWTCSGSPAASCMANKRGGTCGGANGGTYTSAGDIPNAQKCSVGNESAVTDTGAGWSWTCKDHATTPAYCSANKPGLPPGQCGAANGGTYGFSAPSGGDLCFAGTASALNNLMDQWTWTCTGSSVANCQANKQQGMCGAADGSTTATPPNNMQLCGWGSYSAVTDTGSGWSWTCTSLSPAPTTPTNCSASKPATPPGQCGGHDGQTLASTPTSLCNVGTPSGVSDTGAGWSWTCSGAPSANCSASKQSGSCGSANGGSFAAPGPSSNLCNVGSASGVSDTGSGWSWTCNSALSANCSATKPAAVCKWQLGGNIEGWGSPDMMYEDGVNCGPWNLAVQPGAGCTGCMSYPSYNCVPNTACNPSDELLGVWLKYHGTCNRSGGGPFDKTVAVYENCYCDCQ